MLLSCIKRFFIPLLLFSIHVVAFAGNAPVYDADNYPPQFDGSSESGSAVSSAVKSEDSFKSQSLTQDQRLARIEQQMKNLTRSDSASKVETIQTEVQSLRGQVEELSHQLQQAQNQQRVLYADIDKRLSQRAPDKSMSPAPPTDDGAGVKKSSAKGSAAAATAHVVNSKKTSLTPAPAKITASSDQPNVAEEQQIYQTAYDLIKVKKYNEAVSTLQKMLQKYPAGQFAANAHYWLGELYGLLNKNDQSAEEFAAVVKNYPDSPKIADAELKLGLIYAAQFKWPDAKAAFKKVVSHYPGTASARLANEQLKQLKQAQAQAR